ncbi:PTS glucose transporter subunit IIA [Sulfurovum sp.]|jgi:glucose-specific phosphotransferase system IIA component|uniref:PTS sugar transporter subunit IIA n=1 Tax=Sulfurovum sp. TaxID=1969726 RepID=UPI002A371789|nr:PTS glucose transporter subunit IIA [Sulfurovum sp.]MDD2451212.1 PTS glucose transporter subunit IIA [Sulfurovum sp.]MDD3500126.1 PTS glucose transporter subunit IIA [Sulfurovum sp.]MDY0403715.1 PTS glucose transporter subunit IIA [Sulfurovum sp.]
MFGFLKRKQREIFAPVDGQVVALEEVEDEVFSQGMAGDGVAIKPVSGIFTAPISGQVSKIFETNHAYSIKSDKDLEVMVHIGLDTVALKGEGFERLVQEGERVEAGDPVIKADLAYLEEHAKDTITPVLVMEESDVKTIEKKLKIVKSGDLIMEVN